MVGTTRVSEGAPPGPADAVERFDRVERAVHWLNAVLFAVLIVTAAALSLSPVGRIFGHRDVVERVHVWCGLALPIPLLAGAAGRWGRALRADLRRLNRWTATDRTWLRLSWRARAERVRRRGRLTLGKFNAGQKLNAAFTGGAILVMLGSGAIMYWYRPWPLDWRTGATFVHDWLAWALVAAITGHVLFAFADPDALRSMLRGSIARSWARRHAPAWLEEIDQPAAPADAACSTCTPT